VVVCECVIVTILTLACPCDFSPNLGFINQIVKEKMMSKIASAVGKPFLLVSNFLQRAEIGKGRLIDDVKYLFPFFFCIGFSMEVFMVKTGFCR